VARGISITRNDFSSDRPTSSRINESDLDAALNEGPADEYEGERRPLLNEQANELEIPIVEFSNGSSLKEALTPFDKNEWKESNIFFRFMIIVKVSLISF